MPDSYPDLPTPRPVEPVQSSDPLEPTVRVDERGFLADDVNCRLCGYNLRGLQTHSVCPECGTPVGRSTHGDLLRYGDPAWLQKLWLGTLLVLLTIALGFLIAIAAPVLAFSGALGTANLAAIETIANSIGLVFAVGGVIGVWLVTTPDPSGLGEDVYGGDRKFTRVVVVLGLAYEVIEFVGGVAGNVASTMPFMVLAIVMAVVAIAGEYAKLRYYERLSQRIPNEKLSKRARIVRFGYVICFGFMLLFGGAVGLGGAGGQGAMAVFGCLMLPVGLGMLVFMVMYLFLLIGLLGAFGEQRRLAAQWAERGPETAAGPPPTAY